MSALSRRCVLLALVLILPGTALAQKPAASFDYDAEIKRKKAELARVLSQRKKVKKAIKQDRTDFEAYKARTHKRMETIRKRTREIQDASGVQRKKFAALGATIARHRRGVRGYQQRQTIFRRRLMWHCDRLMETARKLPPLVSTKAVVVLDYLKSELRTKAVDNIEGLHRLVRIARKLDAQLMEIQVTRGSSLIPQITGTTSRLRIGGVFEAVARGELAAVWDFERKKWTMINDPAKARMIVNAIEVRTGKKKPALVRIPLVAIRPLKPETTPETESKAGSETGSEAQNTDRQGKKEKSQSKPGKTRRKAKRK